MMRVLESWGHLFGKTLGIAAMGLLLTGCAGAAGADSISELVQRHEDALNPANVVEARAALCAPSSTRRLTAEEAGPSESGLVLGVPLPTPTITPDVEELQRRVGQRWGRGYGTLPGGTVVPMDAIINANRDRHPGEPKGGIVTEEEIANDPEIQRSLAILQAGAEQDKREEAAVAEATREAEDALAAAIATRVADATLTAASSQDNSDAGDEHRPEYEIRNFESIVTDQGSWAEILLDIYADGFPAGHQYSILHGRFEEGQWWVDCDRR